MTFMTVKVTKEQRPYFVFAQSVLVVLFAHSYLHPSYHCSEQGEVDDPHFKVAQPTSDASF